MELEELEVFVLLGALSFQSAELNHCNKDFDAHPPVVSTMLRVDSPHL
jgi:hypothetical protein